MSAQTIRLLSIEDNPGDAELIARALADAVPAGHVLVQAPTLAAGLRLLATEEFHCALLDMSLPDGEGLEILERFQAAAPDVPAVILSGSNDVDRALAAVHKGAQDYLVKGTIDGQLLERTIRHAIQRHQLSSALRGELARRDEFLSHVSHELRTPLSAIHQFVDLLLSGLGGELTDDQRDFVETVKRNSRHLARMIDDLLEVTRMSSGRLTVDPVRVRLADTIDETLKQAQRRIRDKGLAFEVEVEPDLELIADPDRLRQVLDNLLDNTLKFTDSGRIAVRARRWQEDEAFACLSVEDTGCGIAADQIDSIFDRLYQAGNGAANRSRQGLGLGLYICSEIAALHGGRIWVESEAGRGSTFSVTLPVYSVKHLLERMLKRAGATEDRIHLIHVDVARQGRAAPCSVDRGPLRVCRRILDEHLMGVTSVVLPGPVEETGKGAFSVLLSGPVGKAGVIAERIEAAAAANPELSQFDWQVTTRAELLLGEREPSVGARVARLAEQIQQLIEANRTEGSKCPQPHS